VTTWEPPVTPWEPPVTPNIFTAASFTAASSSCVPGLTGAYATF
jgi:hypothetical protein